MTDLNPSSSVLQQAYELIQRDNLVAARDLLDDYLVTHPNDADAWWLYAHAVADPVEAQDALETVLRLRPDYPGASDLLDESQQLLPITDEDLFDDVPVTTTSQPTVVTTPSVQPTPAAPMATTSTSTNTAVRSGGQSPVFLLVAIVVAILLIGLAVILANQANTPSTTPTLSPVATQVAQSTSVSTSEVVIPSTTDDTAGVVGTEDVAGSGTEVVEPDEYADLYAALTGFDVIEGSAVTEDAAIGQTLLVSICNDTARGLRNTSVEALSALAASSANLEATGTEFIGVRILDCQRDNFLLRILALSTADAEAFATGEIDQTALTSRFVAIS